MKLGAFLEGLQIIAKYVEQDSYCIRAEHDQFFAADASLPLSPEDNARMTELGWFEDEDSWSAFT